MFPPWMRGRRGPRPFGPFGHWGPSFEFRGGHHRVRRGDVRAAILALLAERPMHGYEMIRELESRSGGMWRPSPGSVYPTLQLLQDEGLVTAAEETGKRLFSLTDAGRAEAERLGAQGEPWQEFASGVDASEVRLRDAALQVGAAVLQVAHNGSQDQVNRAAEVLAETRRRIYAILGEGA